MRYTPPFWTAVLGRVSLTAVVLLCAGIGHRVRAAQIDSPLTLPSADWHQVDVDQDGDAEISMWRTTWRDLAFSLTVVDGGNDMQWSSDWQDATDFTNDTWLFDYSSDSTFDLAIEFSATNDGHLQASLWDDQDDSGKVELSLDREHVVVTESPHPTLVVSTARDWPDQSGRLAGGLSFLYDGIPERQYRFAVLGEALELDGQPDFETRVVDTNNDGAADFVHTRVLPVISRDYGVPREGLYVNVGSVYPESQGDCLFWPLLNYDPEYREKNYFSSPVHVHVDWDRATIADFGIVGYPIEVGYHVNNLNRWEQGKPNHANFENAMSYYDLANNHDSLPELHVRHVYWPCEDSLYPRNESRDVNEAVYSWRIRESSKLTWDYKISALGSNPITSTVLYDGITLYAVPYWELPTWVVQHRWEIAAFVTVEDREYVSSEGVYEWSTSEGVVNDISAPLNSPERQTRLSRIDQALCISGGADCELGENYHDIAAGLSGEYGQLGGDPLLLYLSPIDNRLHLKWAEHGIWRLDEEQVVRVDNLDGDEFIDAWSREAMAITTEESGGAQSQTATAAEPEVIERLFTLAGHLLHSGGDRIALVEAGFQPSFFETLPPTDHDTWEAHRTQLAPYEAQRRDPRDLRAWLEAFPGPRTEIIGARLAHVRPTGDGFRFELWLKPGYRATGVDLLGLAGLAPGEYLVEYRGDAFSVTPLLPAQLSLEARQLAGDDVTAPFQITIRNTGLADAPRLMLVAEATTSDGELVELTRTPVDALAGEAAQVLIGIPSTVAAGTAIRTRLESGDGQVRVVGAPTALARRHTDPGNAVFSIVQTPLLLPVVGLFAALLVGATLLAIGRGRGRLTT